MDTNSRIASRVNMITTLREIYSKGLSCSQEAFGVMLDQIDDLKMELHDARLSLGQAYIEINQLQDKLEAAVNAGYEQQARADNLEDGR